MTNNRDLYEKARLFRSHGIEKKQHWNMDMTMLGYNYRLNDVSAALGISQLEKIETFLDKRNEIAHFYDQFFEKNPYFYTIKVPSHIRSSRHLYPLLLDRTLWCSKEDIFTAARALGIGVQVHYKPIYQNSYYEKKFGKMKLTTTEEFYRAVLAFPCHQNMNLTEAKELANAFLALLKPYEKGCRY